LFKENSESQATPLSIRPYILTVSGAAPSKNLHRLIRAFSSAQRSELTRGLHLYVVGLAPHEHKQFKKLAKDLGIDGLLILLPRVSDLELKNLYRQALLFVFPSLYEGFGIPLIEAMATGTPVLCSSIPVFHEIGLDFVSYFDPNSISDLEASLIFALSRGQDHNKLQLAKNHVRKNYSYESNQQKISSLFGKIASENL
jgi:glycosyltransferase involved in cell wall biosynthesis